MLHLFIMLAIVGLTARTVSAFSFAPAAGSIASGSRAMAPPRSVVSLKAHASGCACAGCAFTHSVGCACPNCAHAPGCGCSSCGAHGASCACAACAPAHGKFCPCTACISR
ncbi:hypothetical protein M885DRAFT_509320 [Pelagophyceae sp. CCMP2097]|nr:hypothetical protein M885DRAFT_509320 [Pelagophyceae sp. CCMP2097]